MQEKHLTMSLIKAKSNETKTLDQLINEFTANNMSLIRTNMSEFYAGLVVFTNKNFEKYDQELLLEKLKFKCDELDIRFDLNDIDIIYEKMALSAATAIGIAEANFVFNKIDIDAIEAMKKSFYWVSEDHGGVIANELKDFIDKTFTGEIKRADLTKKLKDHFSNRLDKDVKYYDGVTDHIISQSQNVSRVLQNFKYDVKYHKVKAVIDDKTSDICRSMNGRLIPTKHLYDQAQAILSATNAADKKNAAIWMDKPHLAKTLPVNFGLPPYHYRCRTEVVAVYINEEVKVDESSGKEYKVVNTNPNKKYILEHIDKLGVQRKFDSNTFNHSSSSNTRGKPSDKELVAALNSIQEIAPHKYEKKRFIAKSANGYFMVFEADYVYTLFKPEDKKYFDKFALKEQKEVIKWKNTTSISQTDGQSKLLSIVTKLLSLTK